MAKRRRLTKKQKERRRNSVIALLAILFIFISGYFFGRRDITFDTVKDKLDEATSRIEKHIDNISRPASPESKPTLNSSQIHILDVGQGSSILLISRDGTSVLVDTGRYDDGGKRIISYLDRYIGLGRELDLLIFTHNDADHIGHGDLVMEYFDVQEVWMNGMDHTTKVYSNVLDAIVTADAIYREPKAGEVYQRGPFEIQVLHPTANSRQSNHNAESIVTRIAFDGISLLTSGDASVVEEQQIIERSGHLESDMLIVGHHGAADSTGEQWLRAVKPKLAFYQAGLNNTYGHPSPDVIERLEAHNIPVYGTDELGTISIFIGEDRQVSVETEN